VLDVGLIANDEVRQGKGSCQERNGGASPKKAGQAMIVRGIITVLCGVGLYASLFMLHKSRRAARGELLGPSVVKTPRAHLFGVPNSLLGSLYYSALAIAVWFVRPPATILLLATVFFAAATSVVLGYSLLFVTRRGCPYCWTSHAVNWALLALSAWIFVPDVLSKGI
jgi:uncharacterized membrane protein